MLLCGLAYQGKKDIVFRFIIEYSSLRNFGPLYNGFVFIWGFLKRWYFWLVLKLEISYRVMISCRILDSFEDYILAWWNDRVIGKVTLSFHPVFRPPFTPYPLFQWYPQSKDILINLSMKCCNSVRREYNPITTENRRQLFFIKIALFSSLLS
jgi:hypothetical protein